MGQKEMILHLISKHGRNKDTVCTEYALAERRGEVPRRRNKNGLAPEQYAYRLWNNGLLRGWF